MGREIELLAPARNIEIGIAAIDCGADAVYIAGPNFGARSAAGNSLSDIKKLCEYADRFGARIFMALNTIIFDEELSQAYDIMLQAQDAGVDAIIIQDLALLEMAKNGYKDKFAKFNIPLHASTQCAIRTPEQAQMLEGLGFSRLILERGISLEQIRAIREVTSCELEFFVHGALCVCYSGQCYISEKIAGRSANRGACIQACRSKYDLIDTNGRILAKDKALLSLKDFNLKAQIQDLIDAGISSFKIEGRLKNMSYVKNVVKEYSLEIDEKIANSSNFRAAYGRCVGGFTPDRNKTFNRGYTELFINGKRGKWASMETAKSMGEEIGAVSRIGKSKTSFDIKPNSHSISLNNGDGFTFSNAKSEVFGVRGDVCTGFTVRCKPTPELYVGAKIYRNYNSVFEKETEKNQGDRLIQVTLDVKIHLIDSCFYLNIVGTSEDGRTWKERLECGTEEATNSARMGSIIETQLSKKTGHYIFGVVGLDLSESEGKLPFMSASSINEIRRRIAEVFDVQGCIPRPLENRPPLENLSYLSIISEPANYKFNISNHLAEEVYRKIGFNSVEKAYELDHRKGAELMRNKYCIKYELGLCPKLQGAKNTGKLALLNNKQVFPLEFDCKNCEMVVLSNDEF